MSGEFHLLLSQSMNTDFGLPFIALLADMPVISQGICYEVAQWRYFGTADGIPCKVQGFDFVPYIEIPEVYKAITSASHEPNGTDRWEWNGINWEKDDFAGGLLVFVRLKCDDRFLN